MNTASEPGVSYPSTRNLTFIVKLSLLTMRQLVISVEAILPLNMHLYYCGITLIVNKSVNPWEPVSQSDSQTVRQ